MGKINLLKADYIGKVGQTYGVRQYRQSIVKATPFSHTPHNTAQKKAVRAFEKLNRFSAYVARTFWRYLNLSDRTMNKHNAVAKRFGLTVENGLFNLQKIVEVIPAHRSLSFGEISIDFDSKTASVHFNNSQYSPETTEEHIFIALVADNGTVKAGGAFSPISQTVQFAWDYTDFVSLSVVMFKACKVRSKYLQTGFCYYSENADFVIDGILYTSLMPLTSQPTYNNGRLVFDSADVNIASNILHFLNI